ncbi:MAG TPA: hypothetical protein PL045_04360 [Chitinophagaceae bacterium]|nr:hypothetical protein [Chitinophagaceae bacterium]
MQLINYKGTDYLITSRDYKDIIFYEITSMDKAPFVIAINEHAEWEANSDQPDDLIKFLGESIEKGEL